MEKFSDTKFNQIIGLQKDREYIDIKSLRYIQVMIKTDWDIDGSHIKRLIINLSIIFGPHCFEIQRKSQRIYYSFNQSIQSLRNNKFAQIQDIKTWKICYYKGIGISDDVEAQEYFLIQLLIPYNLDIVVNMMINQSIYALITKNLMIENNCWHNIIMIYILIISKRNEDIMTLFIKKQFTFLWLIEFLIKLNIISVPSMMDGTIQNRLKKSFICKFQEEFKTRIQLRGYKAEHQAYHDDDISFLSTIISMAQNFFGSNNINLLLPRGQFGSRAMRGKDHFLPDILKQLQIKLLDTSNQNKLIISQNIQRMMEEWLNLNILSQFFI